MGNKVFVALFRFNVNGTATRIVHRSDTRKGAEIGAGVFAQREGVASWRLHVEEWDKGDKRLGIQRDVVRL